MFVLLFIVSLILVKGCPFDSYYDSLIDEGTLFESQNILISTSDEQGDSFGFGFWSLNIPRPGESKQNPQILFKLQSLSSYSYSLLGLQQLLYLESKYSIGIYYINTEYNTQKLEFVFNSQEYQAIWMFIFISIKLNAQMVIININEQFQIIQDLYIESNQYYEIIIGAYQQFTVGNEFRGKLSKQIIYQNFFYSEVEILNIMNTCKIPPLKPENQVFSIVQGVVQFLNNDSPLITSVYQIGPKYCVNGWIKYTIQSSASSQTQQLIRLSQSKDQSSDKSLGDNLFTVETNFNQITPSQSKLKVQIDTSCYDSDECSLYFSSDFTSFYYLEYIFQDLSTDSYYTELQKWHFMQYEYGRSNDTHDIISIQFLFFDKIGLIEKTFDQIYMSTYLYGNIFIFIGEQNLNIKALQAQLAYFNFFYNYKDDKLLEYECHYSCLTCNGPLNNNCLDCLPNQNRFYNDELKSCQCYDGYQDDDQYIECYKIDDSFQTVIQQELVLEGSNFCQYGYFVVKLIDNQILCLQCPTSQVKQLQCIECFFYPKNWYLQPVCTKDLIQRGIYSDDAFYYFSRPSNDIDLYFINEQFMLQFHPGFQSFCDNQNEVGCHLVKYTHLKQPTYVKCKQNYIYSQNDCVYSGTSCSVFDNFNNCIECQFPNMYLYNSQCFLCPKTCLTCYYDENTESVLCKSCSEFKTLSNGICYSCGTYCKILKCIDDSKYYLSTDRINCKINSIPGCKYAVEYYPLYNYDCILDQNGLAIICVKCEPLTVYNVIENSCQQDQFSNQEYDPTLFPHKCYLSYISIYGITKCILSAQYPYALVNYQGCQQGCQQFLLNCIYCYQDILSQKQNDYKCILCQAGYYSERLSGACKSCQNVLNCAICGEQQKIAQDYWTWELQPFLKSTIVQADEILKIDQSNNVDDYELICLQCSKGYQFYNNKCIKQCPENCQECEIKNEENICVRCTITNKGRMLSLYNNECIDCPQNCALCRKRSQEEIQAINPLFKNSEYKIFTNQCLQSFNDDKNYFYDSFIGDFVICQSNNFQCYHEFLIPLNLYCNFNEYQYQLDQLEDSMKLKFKQQNILLSDMFSEQNFQEFQNSKFYNFANLKSVKSIKIIITSQQQQFCQSGNSDLIIQELFRENIFTVKKVEIELNLQNTVFILNSMITFKNFNKITLNGIIIQINSDSQNIGLKFQGFDPQNITFSNSKIEQLNKNNKYFTLSITEAQNIIFQNIELENISGYFNIMISSNIRTIAYNKYIFEKLSLKQCKFQNQPVFYLNLDDFDQISFRNIDIKGSFTNSSFLIHQSKPKNASLTLDNFSFQGEIMDTIKFIELNIYFQIIIQALNIQSSKIINTNFICLNCYFQLTDIILNNTRILNNSTFLNNYYISECSQTLKLSNLQLLNNQYDHSIYLIRLKNVEKYTSIIEMQQIFLDNNFSPTIRKAYQQFEKALVYIQIENIQIKQLNIAKGYGMIEISISNCLFLDIQQVSITMDKFSFLGLHQLIDCIQRKLDYKVFKEAIFIYDSKSVHLVDIEINQLTIINFPIITYKSAEVFQISTSENIVLRNLKMKNNLLIQSESQKTTALIQIVTQQQSSISFENIEVTSNILHEYIQSRLSNPSSIIVLIGEFSNIEMRQVQFSYNMIINSTDNLLYINCNNLTILDGTFQENNIFNYSVIQKHLLWGFESTQSVNIEILESQFKIQSLTGNGVFIAQNIFIRNCNFNRSSGKQAGAISIRLQNSAIFEILNSTFSSIDTSFIENTKTGGTIFIDMSNSQLSILNFKQIKANNIFSRTSGLFFFEQGSSQIKVSIYNLTIQNVYSLSGSIVSAIFSEAQSQFIEISNVNITNTIEGQLEYISLFKNILEQEQGNLILSRQLFIFEQIASLKCSNFQIRGLIFESFLSIIAIPQIYLDSIKISNSQVSTQLFSIVPNLYYNSSFYLSNFQLLQISLGYMEFQFQCIDETIENFQEMNFQCLITGQIAPEYILYSTKNLDKLNRAGCQLNQLKDTLQTSIKQNFSNYNVKGLMVFSDFIQPISLRLSQFKINLINCSYCSNGILSLIYQKDSQQFQLRELKIKQSFCGQKGCINLQKQISNKRILNVKEKTYFEQQFEVIVVNCFCSLNQANYGVCLNINSSNVLVKDSIFQNNQAINFGGSIYFEGEQNFYLLNNIIQNNTAQIGGGVYFKNYLSTDYINNQNIIQQNLAYLFGSNILTQPEKLTIILQKGQSNFISTIYNSNQMQVDQIQFQRDISIIQTQNFYIVPSGQLISKYQYFNWKTSSYTDANFIFRVHALTRDQEVVKQLNNTYCNLKTRKFNISNPNQDQEYQNNYTNFNKFVFHTETQDYNFDDLIIYFDSDYESNIVLQLEINCNSIVIPVFNKTFPYNLINHHQNYILRANFKTLPCQYGEIKNQTDSSCHVCDSNSGLFSISINSQKCELQDDQTTISVKPAQLQLRTGYWRPYFSTSNIEKCINYIHNCQGGWIQGDTSCFLGHIGALCEQCDIYNIRGDGEFTISDQYQCGRCTEQVRNTIMILIVIIWTMVSLFVSTSGVLKTQEEYLKPSPFFKIRFTRNLNKSQSSALIKMLTSYLQIIASITTFQLNLPIGFSTTVNAVGNPIQTMAYSLDCFLATLFDIDIQYGRIIWQLITPSFYVLVFIGLYRIAAHYKMVVYSLSVLFTSFLYICIYFQPNLIGGLIQLISFREISGFKWIQANVSIRYDTSIHLNWMLKFCLPIILVLAVILPFYLFWNLYKNKNNLELKQVRNMWGYLYHEYKNVAYFWEIIKIMEKELIIIILNFYEDNIVLKAIIIQFITYVYCELNRIYSPYFLKNLNILDYYSANISMITIGLALGAYISQLRNSEETKIPIYIVMIILNFQFLAQILIKIISEYLKAFSNLLQMMRTQIYLHFPRITSNQFLNKHFFKHNIEQQRMEQIFQNFRTFSNQIGRQALKQKKLLFESNSFAKNLTSTGNNYQDFKQFILKQPESMIITDGQEKNLKEII